MKTEIFEQAKLEAEAFIADQRKKDYVLYREHFGLTEQDVDNERKPAASGADRSGLRECRAGNAGSKSAGAQLRQHRHGGELS